MAGGLLDIFTGGKDEEAAAAQRDARMQLSGVQTPTAAQLTLPELQKYVQAGIMTPAEAEAVLQKQNAYDQVQTGSRPVEAEMSALSKMQDIAESGGMDAQAKAKLAQALNTSQINAQGQRGAIMDQMAARGIPTSLMSEAMQSASAGQDAQNLSLAGTQAAGDAEQRALQALAESSQLGGQIHGQQYNEAANKAQAANAIAQWNAGNQTNVNQANAGMKQQANLYNTGAAQDISNQNTGLTNQRTQYNAQVPQQVFNNSMAKATGVANQGNQIANTATAQGQQNAGLLAGLIGAGATFFGGPAAGVAAKSAVDQTQQKAQGGMIEGHAKVPGDSSANDTIPAMLSAGEVVVPRSIAPHPEMAKQFISHVMRNKVPMRPVHHEDIKNVLEALTSRREAA